MKEIIQLSILGFCLIGILSWSFPNNDLWKEKVNEILLEQAINDGIVEMMLLFKTKADISIAETIINKEAKGNYVFQELQKAANRDQASVKLFLESKNINFKSFILTNAIFVNGDIELIKLLAEFDEVKKIINNPQVKFEQPIEESVAESRGPETIEWGVSMIGADQVWEMGYRGEGAIVAGEDTGYDWEHPALKNAYRGWNGATADHNYNWHDAIHEINPLHGDTSSNPFLNPCGLDVNMPCDDHSHGTRTMGVMVGEDGENQIGVAPGAKWMACRNMERGYGSPATYIECFEFFLAPTDLNNENPDPTKAPHVINNSWSCPEMEGCNLDNWDMMETVVNNLKAAGIVVVVSAGNAGSGCETVNTPAAMFSNSFTIGSTDADDDISSFSSRGPVAVDSSDRMKPNVVAPGRDVRSSILNGAYSSASGTSLSGPHAAGLVALIISANPELAGQVELIETIIENSAVPKTTDEMCGDIPGSEIPNLTYGYGRIDALAAVEEALSFITATEDTEQDVIINVYPNPASEVLSLDFGLRKGQANVYIYDASGKVVLTKLLSINGPTGLNVSKLHSGFYFYKIEFEKKFYKGKVMIK